MIAVAKTGFKWIAVTLLLISLAVPAVEARRRTSDSHQARISELKRQVQNNQAATVVYELESMTRQDPSDFQAWLLLSRVYLDLDFSGNMIGKAMAAAQKAVELRPHNSTCLKSLAEIYARKGLFKEALALLDKAEQESKVDPFVYKAKALILSETKRDKEALVAWEKFLEMHPNAALNYSNLDGGAIIYARAGKTDKAIVLYDKLSEMRPGPFWIMRKAEAYTLGGRLKDAIDLYSKQITKNPDDELAHLERAKLYSRLGRYKEALSDMNAAIKELPSASMYLQRANIFEKLGDARAAKRDRETARSLD